MGLIGYWLAESGRVIMDEVVLLIPREKRSRFMADWWAHTTSYAVGLVGGLVVMVRVWRRRCRANDRAQAVVRSRSDQSIPAVALGFPSSSICKAWTISPVLSFCTRAITRMSFMSIGRSGRANGRLGFSAT